ncbi:MAG: esterase-like activity of phytase family protein, partial [Pseudomonadota bacterium]
EDLVISFERDHRLMTHRQGGQLGGTVYHRDWETMSSNKGLEALAALPDGTLLAVGEGQQNGQYRTYQISPGGQVEKRLLPADGVYLATGADIGPDGRLYLLIRHFTVLTGVSARILRYDLDPEGWPIPASRKRLARFSARSGVDNMEGIATWTDRAGRARLTLISDDNFRGAQRTILIDMAID